MRRLRVRYEESLIQPDHVDNCLLRQALTLYLPALSPRRPIPYNNHILSQSTTPASDRPRRRSWAVTMSSMHMEVLCRALISRPARSLLPCTVQNLRLRAAAAPIRYDNVTHRLSERVMTSDEWRRVNEWVTRLRLSRYLCKYRAGPPRRRRHWLYWSPWS